MKQCCELCGKRARMYCESDQAKLCWDCDEKVHGANFLVEKHSRSLLCHVCQSPTPWNASGPKLTPTVSICEDCVANHSIKCEQEDIDDDGDSSSSGDNGDSYYQDDDDHDDDVKEEEEEGEHQVVPWSSTSSLPPPLASSSSSDGETSSAAAGDLAYKRLREDSHIDSDDDIACSSSQMPYGEGISQSFFRPLKQPRISEPKQAGNQSPPDSRPADIVSSLLRLGNNTISKGEDAAATILGICTKARNQNR
ncbi:Zinc finger, B-box [Quillaja saponaria]|uniref:Zinc finger, B-box n=1 Tax=Quillaja saponaria TaxID=32244 RepID=A0AAD7KZ36_QUISA|nr:Zinc finger, B-box [Quillaja saponaria]